MLNLSWEQVKSLISDIARKEHAMQDLRIRALSLGGLRRVCYPFKENHD